MSMSTLKESIILKLDALPEPALRRVWDYLSLVARQTPAEESSVLAVAGHLSGAPMSAIEIEESLYGADHQGRK